MLYNTSKNLYICDTMKHINTILHAFSLSFVLTGALIVATLTSHANNIGLVDDDNKDKVKKAEDKITLAEMPKANLSLDAGFRFSGNMNAGFHLSDNNQWNFKSVMTFKRGNATYVLPYAAQIQQPTNMNLGFHHLQIVLPLKKKS